MINKKLAEKMNLNEDIIKKIEELHLKRKDYYNRMEIAPVDDLKEWDRLLTELEYDLQELWGFPMDSKYHKFWERPHCLCPKMDNRDRYPSGYYVINEECPLHGKLFKENK